MTSLLAHGIWLTLVLGHSGVDGLNDIRTDGRSEDLCCYHQHLPNSNSKTQHSFAINPSPMHSIHFFSSPSHRTPQSPHNPLPQPIIRLNSPVSQTSKKLTYLRQRVRLPTARAISTQDGDGRSGSHLVGIWCRVGGCVVVDCDVRGRRNLSISGNFWWWEVFVRLANGKGSL